MADSKIVYTRIAQRIDYENNWVAKDPTLLKGEIAITYVPSVEEEGSVTYPRLKFKVGDGVTPWSDLPYSVDEDAIYQQLTALNTKIDTGLEGIQTDIGNLGGSLVKAASYEALSAMTGKKGDIGLVEEVIVEADSSKNIEKRISLTAYAYDSASSRWVALDGNYNAENVYFDEDLITTTAVGNITLTNGQATISTKGKNLKEAFEAIFVSEITTGLQKTPPSLMINGSTTYVEVGSKVTPYYTTTFTVGEYQYGPATGITASDYIVSNNKTNETRDTVSGSFAEYQFTDTSVDEIKYTLSATCTSSQGAVPVSNLGNPVESQRFGSTSRTASDKTLFASYKPNFYGYKTSSNKLALIDKTTVNSDFIRALGNNQRETKAPLTSYNVTSKWYQFFYAVPTGRKTGLTAKDGNNVTLPVEKLENVTITHENGITSSYTVFFINNANEYDPTKIQLAW